MPDYDPKSIPILDDIIEGENAGAIEISDKSLVPEKRTAEHIIPDTDQEDDTVDMFSDETAAPEVEIIESALIDYQDEEDNDDSIEHAAKPQDRDHAANEKIGQITAPIDLRPIVDDVVKQLMPDLEQQLRFLVHQALAEKLPDEIIKNMSARTSTENDEP